jgi:hypothetical protein
MYRIRHRSLPGWSAAAYLVQADSAPRGTRQDRYLAVSQVARRGLLRAADALIYERSTVTRHAVDTGDWLSGRAPRSHRGGHWFDPSIAHQFTASREQRFDDNRQRTCWTISFSSGSARGGPLTVWCFWPRADASALGGMR